MISKVITGNNFLGCCRYVCSDTSRVDVLEVNGVRDSDYQLMASDFEENRKQRESKKKAVFHGILSFPKHENPERPMLVEIAQKYLKQIGFENSQYVIAMHKDKEHCHLHLISSFVDMNGNAVNENWIGLNAKKVSQKLTLEYGLTPAIRKDLKQTNLEALSEKEYLRYQMYDIINRILPTVSNISELSDSLKNENISVELKTKKGDENTIQGVSFKSGDYCFKGSEIDRKLSYGNLLKQMTAKPLVECHTIKENQITQNNINQLNM